MAILSRIFVNMSPPMLPMQCLLLLIVLFSRSLAQDGSNPDEWYTKYAHYPPYCSTPAEMEKRTIPPIPNDARLGESRIVHATAIIRHGARTPYSSDLHCWNGYHESPERIWNCNLTTYTAPPTPHEIDTDEERHYNDENKKEDMFLFAKHYDALQTPEYNLSNYLRGTCQLGQLLLQGYEQELVNGQHLRNAYIYDSSKYNHDDRFQLLDSHNDKQPIWHDLVYRVDDDQRTVMSGQVLLRGMMGPELESYYHKHHFNPIIPLHTADRYRDIVDPNEYICPRLAEMDYRIQQSQAYQTFNSSQEASTLRAFMQNVLKLDQDMDAIDCLMTTICTDRTLPDAINDYGGQGRRHLHQVNDSSSDDSSDDEPDYGTNLFQRLFDFEVQQCAMVYQADQAAYSKLAMAPLWAEIMGNILPILGIDDDCCPKRAASSKLAIFSGHDTTLMPLLASLGVWDGEWAPYASMMILEIHDINIDSQTDRQVYRSNYAFRLLYNGQVLTHLVNGCPKDAQLCDAQVLVNHVRPFATVKVDCARKFPVPQKYQDTVSRAMEIVSTPGGIVALCFIILGSAVFGALAMFFYLTAGTVPRRKRRLYNGIALTQMSHSSDDDGDENGFVEEQGRAAEAAALNATIT